MGIGTKIIYEIQIARAKISYYKNKIRLLKDIGRKGKCVNGRKLACDETLSSPSPSSSSSNSHFKSSNSSKSFTSFISHHIKNPSKKALSPFNEGGIDFLRLNDEDNEDIESSTINKDVSMVKRKSKNDLNEWHWPELSKDVMVAAIECFFEVIFDSDPSNLDKNSFPIFMTFYNSRYATENSLPLNAIKPENYNQVVSEILKRVSMKM